MGAAFGQGIRAYLRAGYQDAVEHFRKALIAAYANDEEKAQIYDRERAIIYLYIGNALVFQEAWDDALREYLAAVETEPALAEAHYNLGVAFAARGQLERAVSAFKEALDHNPHLYEAHFALGRCYQRLDDVGRAYIYYSNACNARPHAAEPLYYMGLMHQNHGAHDLAKRCFAEALRVEPTFISPEVHDDDALTQRSESEVIQWYYRLSDDLKHQHYPDEAARIYRALLQWRPEEYEATYLLGNLLARERQWDDAVTHYRQVPPTHRRFTDAQLRISTVLRLQHRYQEAYQVLYACAKLYPRNGHLYAGMGKLLYDMGKHEAARRAFERAVQLLPNNAQAHYLLGFVYMVIGRENWTIAAWRKAVELAPDNLSLRYDLGYLYVRHRHYKLAAGEFELVMSHWQDDVETGFMLGLCYKELLEPSRAITLLEKVLRREPRHAQALFHLGACYLQVGNVSLGKAYLRRYDHLLRQQSSNRGLRPRPRDTASTTPTPPPGARPS